MRWKKIDPQIEINPEAGSIFHVGKKDRPGVLLLHGYTGSPWELGYLAGRLAGEGYTVSVPRLPGHGTNGKDFLVSGARDWWRRSVDAYAELSQTCSEIYIAGLSMGSLLTILLAARTGIRKIALAAPALCLRSPIIYLAPLASLFVKKIRRSYKVEDWVPEKVKALREEYHTHLWVSPAAELYRLRQQAKKALPSVLANTLTIVSKNDETVHPKSLPWLEARIGSQNTASLVLDKSGHSVTIDSERERVAAAIIEWFAKN